MAGEIAREPGQQFGMLRFIARMHLVDWIDEPMAIKAGPQSIDDRAGEKVVLSLGERDFHQLRAAAEGRARWRLFFLPLLFELFFFFLLFRVVRLFPGGLLDHFAGEKHQLGVARFAVGRLIGDAAIALFADKTARFIGPIEERFHAVEMSLRPIARTAANTTEGKQFAWNATLRLPSLYISRNKNS